MAATDQPDSAQQRLLPGAPLFRDAEITGRSGLTYRQWLDTGTRDFLTGHSLQTYDDFLREFAVDHEETLLVAQIRNPADGTWYLLEPPKRVRLDDLDAFVTDMQAVLRDQWYEDHADDQLPTLSTATPVGFLPLPVNAGTPKEIERLRALLDEALLAPDFRWGCPACEAIIPLGQLGEHVEICNERMARHEFTGMLAVVDECQAWAPRTAEDVVDEIAAGPWDLRRAINLIPLTSRGMAGWKPKKKRKRRRRG